MIPRWVIFQIITLPEKLRLLLSEISVANLVANFIIAATEKKYQNTEEIRILSQTVQMRRFARTFDASLVFTSRKHFCVILVP